MRILVTGGTGFLGKHLSSKLQNQNVWMPSRKDLNVLNSDSIYDIIDYSPDVILHMAALCGGILANKNSPADFLHKNVDMTSNIFCAAKAIKQIGKDVKIYTLGSVCAYPKFCPVPFKEDDIWNGYPEETNAPYGMAKRLQMLMGQTYREQYGIGGAHLIPVNLYGEHDHFDLTNSHVIPALIRKFEDANYQPGTGVVKLWGTGKATREFLYAGDAAEAIAKAVITGFDSPLPINLGTGKDISIEDLAHLIKKLTNSRALIQFTGEVSDGQPKRMLDVTRAKELLGWTAGTDFEEGLSRTIRWYRENHEQIIAADAS